jgi:Uma2 family endonuclease
VRLGTQRRRRVPDILFVSTERQGILRSDYVEGAPDLAIEIVSPESLSRDWREKYLEYEAAGVREYWIIDPMARRVEAYVLGDDGHYARLPEEEGVIRSVALPGFYLRTDWLWQEPLPNVLEIAKELGVV